MIRYGEVKRGSGKIHPHNECCVCSEKTISKKAARRRAREDMGKSINEFYKDEIIETSIVVDQLFKRRWLWALEMSMMGVLIGMEKLSRKLCR